MLLLDKTWQVRSHDNQGQGHISKIKEKCQMFYFFKCYIFIFQKCYVFEYALKSFWKMTDRRSINFNNQFHKKT